MIDATFNDRVAAVRARLAAACASAGRAPEDVRLIAVTKTHPPEAANAAVAAGITDIGENRVQELTAKYPLVAGAQWHLVGRLQRNKAREVVGRDVLVHSVDKRSLAEALSRRAQRQEATQRVLIQVNVGDDPAKGGCSLPEVHDLVAYSHELPNLRVEGLMTIPPLPPQGLDQNQASRAHFAALRSARDQVRAEFPAVTELSMGMSADLEAAVHEGATMVRLGTAMFGPRGDGPWRKDQA